MVLGLFCLLRKREVVAQRYFQHFECALDLGHTITYGSGRPDVTLERLVNDRAKDPELTFDSIERVPEASSSRFERPKQQAPLIARSGFREQCSKEKFDGADRDIHLGGDFFRAESSAISLTTWTSRGESGAPRCDFFLLFWERGRRGCDPSCGERTSSRHRMPRRRRTVRREHECRRAGESRRSGEKRRRLGSGLVSYWLPAEAPARRRLLREVHRVFVRFTNETTIAVKWGSLAAC